MSQIQLFLRLYISPWKSFSRVLDEGQFVFAALAAVAVVLALQVPRAAEVRREESKAAMRAVRARVDRAVAKAKQKGAVDAGQAESAVQDEMQDLMADSIAPQAALPSLLTAVNRFTAQNPTQYLSPLFAMAVCFVPMVILVLTFWDNLGGFQTILFRDYMALLVCCLLAWTAPYLLLTLAATALRAAGLTLHPALWWTAQAWFLLLAAMAIRTLFGTKFLHAAGATGAGWIAGAGGIWVYGMFGSASAYLASPFVLYYLYMGIGPQVRGLGGGLLSRQRFKQRLENATLNPRDADAHYQLGLLYAQRRQYAPAIERFRRAIEIDPAEPDAYYQLGRIAREQGRYAEAIEYCRTAARIDDKHSSSEVWREIGIAGLLSGDAAGARQALEKYLDRRPYDPEGSFWYGRTMVKLGHCDEARNAFNQAIESVRTMPAARKRQVRSWESEARREMKRLPVLSAR